MVFLNWLENTIFKIVRQFLGSYFLRTFSLKVIELRFLTCYLRRSLAFLVLVFLTPHCIALFSKFRNTWHLLSKVGWSLIVLRRFSPLFHWFENVIMTWPRGFNLQLLVQGVEVLLHYHLGVWLPLKSLVINKFILLAKLVIFASAWPRLIRVNS